MIRSYAILLTVVAAFLLGLQVGPIEDPPDRPPFSPRVAEFEGLTEPVDIVLLGDSLTDHGRWSELLKVSFANRGIGGDRVGMATRRAEHLPEGPIYVMLGINDLAAGVGIKQIAKDYRALLTALEGRDITVQSVLGPGHLPVRELNRDLQELAAEMGADYMDLTPILGDPLKYTYDGIHLTSDGYRLWAEALNESMAATDQVSSLTVQSRSPE